MEGKASSVSLFLRRFLWLSAMLSRMNQMLLQTHSHSHWCCQVARVELWRPGPWPSEWLIIRSRTRQSQQDRGRNGNEIRRTDIVTPSVKPSNRKDRVKTKVTGSTLRNWFFSAARTAVGHSPNSLILLFICLSSTDVCVDPFSSATKLLVQVLHPEWPDVESSVKHVPQERPWNTHFGKPS